MSENPLADIVEPRISNQRHTRVPFVELCGFYAALQLGVSRADVVFATGLSPGAIYYLSQAGHTCGGQFRYPRIAAEWARLGREAFVEKYLHAAIRDRLRVAHAAVRQKLAPGGAPPAINPRANAYKGAHRFKLNENSIYAVDIAYDRNPKNPGWVFRHRLDYGEAWRGDGMREEARFASSRDCWLHCRQRYVTLDVPSEIDNFFFGLPPYTPERKLPEAHIDA